MSSRWGSRAAFKSLAGYLSASEGLDFQRKVLPYLQLAFPELVEAPTRRSWDRSGVDLLVWSDSDRLPLVVQTKGFQVDDRELGASQIQQGLKSIESFVTSSLSAENYLLVVNRNGSDEYWAPVLLALRQLVTDGHATNAFLVRRTDLLRRAFDGAYAILEQSLHAGAARYQVDLEHLSGTTDALHSVPLRVAELITDPHGVAQLRTIFRGTADPLTCLEPPPPSRLTLVIGEFGTGKTVTALRAARELRHPVLLLPGARIRVGTRTGKQLIEQFIDIDTVLSNMPDGDPRGMQAILRTAADLLFKQEDARWILLIDGIDESYYVTAPGGFTVLMNQLYGVRTPVVLTIRSEYWNSSLSEMTSALVDRPEKARHQRTTHRIIELDLWDDPLIVQYIQSRLEREADRDRTLRLVELMSVVSQSKYRAYYGDIPTRPLFIRMLTDVTATHGLRGLSRRELMEMWIEEKLQRDYSGPRAIGGVGRAGVLAGDTFESRMPLVFMAMRAAARSLANIDHGVVRFRTWLNPKDIRRKVPALLTVANWTGLFLNSLLMVDRGRGEDILRVRFAHQAFAEYFLALDVFRDPGHWHDCKLPAEVQLWLEEFGEPD